MSISIIKNRSRFINFILFLLIPCFGIAQAQEFAYPERTINGIRYFKETRIRKNWRDLPSLMSLRKFGFSVNINENNSFIAPDGKIIPRFDNALRVVALNKPNTEEDDLPEDFIPISYSGNIYLPDVVEDFKDGEDLFVLCTDVRPMGNSLISIRTPLYMPLNQGNFSYAVNMQKIQIGTCYMIEACSFLNCTKLETVIFEQAPYVEKYGFMDCAGIKNIVLLSSKELPLLEDIDSFDLLVYKYATVYVPESLMDAFKCDPVWSRFSNVRSLSECTIELMKQ